MQRRRFYGFALSMGLALTGGLMLAQNKTVPMTKQVERGKEIFLHSAKGTACGTCHEVGGVGTAIGPDLKKLASVVGPRGMVSTIQMSMTAYVQEYKIKDVGTFPVFRKRDRAGLRSLISARIRRRCMMLRPAMSNPRSRTRSGNIPQPRPAIPIRNWPTSSRG